MNFNQLVSLFEAKGTKPGERFFNAKRQEGPAGIASSPIGKDNYNPEMREREVKHKDDKGDIGMGDMVSIISLLGKGLQLLKNDDVFEDQMRGIMNGFKKNRHQISAYQESVLKSKPKVIDNQWGEIHRLTKVVNNPEMREHKDWAKYDAELRQVVANKNENEAILNAVYDEIDGVTDRNEELNNEYLEQLMTAVKHTTKRLYSQLTKQIQEEGDAPHQMKPITMHDLDWSTLEKQLAKDSSAQLQLLEMLMSDSDKNPLVRFMKVQEQNYNGAKDRYFQVRKGDNYSITTDQLYQNLPLFTFVRFLSNAALKSPKIPLTTKQKNTVKATTADGGMLDRLAHISNERQFEEIKPELLEYIDGLEIDDIQKGALRQLANGKFAVRKGAPNAAFKIRSSLKSSQITESFDDYLSKVLIASRFDDDDYKLDMIEIFG